MSLQGYYLTCDDAECLDCFAEHGGEEAWKQSGGFESWEEPIAIDSLDETDSPIHCVSCGRLIDQDLTPDGYAYVGEYVLEGFSRGSQNPVTVQWVEAYGDEIYFSDVDGLPDAETVLALYKRLPIDRAWIDTDREDLRRHARLAGWPMLTLEQIADAQA